MGETKKEGVIITIHVQFSQRRGKDHTGYSEPVWKDGFSFGGNFSHVSQYGKTTCMVGPLFLDLKGGLSIQGSL